MSQVTGERPRLVLFHTMDPRGQKLGGIETHVRLMLARFPGEVLFVGLDEIGDLVAGEVRALDYEGREIRFLPVVRSDPASINTAARRLTRSTTLRFMLGALRHLPAIRRAIGRGPASCEIERFEFALLPRLLRRPFVLMVHNEGTREDAMDSLIKRYWAVHLANERIALELATRVFAVNPSIAARIAGFSPRFAARTEVLSVSVDTARFAPSPFEGGDTFRVCFAGRLDAFKDPPLMFASLAETARRLADRPVGRFRRLAFDYVGASDPAAFAEFAAIAGFTERHGIRAAPEVAAIMRRAHAGLVTSFFEGMPCYLLEMLASGRPLATVDLPQFGPVIRPDCSGRIVARGATQAESAERLAEALLAIVDDVVSGRFVPAAIAAQAQPFSVEVQMGRLFTCHGALARR